MKQIIKPLLMCVELLASWKYNVVHWSFIDPLGMSHMNWSLNDPNYSASPDSPLDLHIQHQSTKIFQHLFILSIVKKFPLATVQTKEATCRGPWPAKYSSMERFPLIKPLPEPGNKILPQNYSSTSFSTPIVALPIHVN